MRKFKVIFCSFDRFHDEFIEHTWTKVMTRRGVVKARRAHMNASDSFSPRVRRIERV